MTAYEFLSQAYLLDQQIRSKREQLVFLRSMATSFYNPTDQEQISCTPNTYAMEDAVLKIIEAEQDLNDQIAELVDTMMEIKRVVARVQNVEMRLILEKRYLVFQTWRDIAADLGHSLRWVQERHKMALEVVERIIGDSPYKT